VHESIRLGIVRGITVGVHWSVLAIAALLTWGLAGGYLPAAAPGYRAGAYWLVAGAAVVVFFASLLGHELGHSLMALRRGVRVDRITLWLFGGVAQLRGDPPDPRAEFEIAAAGPGVSLAVAAAGGIAAGLVGAVGGPDLAVAGLAWLALVNVVLAGFNLVPAAPLDGGRLLHALVWHTTHDRMRATRVATTAGRGFGTACIAVGIIGVAGGALAGAWLVLVGWFVLTAAGAEAAQAVLVESLAGVRVRDVMTTSPITVRADAAVSVVLEETFLRHHCSAFPVVDGGGWVVGLLTLRQVREVAAAERAHRTAAQVAHPVERVTCVGPDEPLVRVLGDSAPDGAAGGRMLVLDHDHLVGIVSPNDVHRAIRDAVA
jgi:Zn-dependent protease/predicted transcriptional regulator